MPSALDRAKAALAGRGDVVDSAVRAAEGTTAERDTPPVAETKPHTESIGMGRDLAAETLQGILDGLDLKIAAARKAGNDEMVATLQERKVALKAQ